MFQWESKVVILVIMLSAAFLARHAWEKHIILISSAEVLSLAPEATSSTVVIGAVQKGFPSGVEPGLANNSIGYQPADGR
jgi:hypothetical protein